MNIMCVKKFAESTLRKMHLFGPVYRTYVRIQAGGNADALNFIEGFIQTVRAKSAAYQNDTVLFYGFMLTERKKVIYDVMEQITECRPGVNIFVLQNALRIKKTEKKLRDTVVPADVMLFPEYGRREIEIGLLPPFDEGKERLFREKRYLQEAMENLQAMIPGASPSMLKSLVCEYHRAYSAVLDEMKIATVVIWNKFHACHYIFSQLCNERGVRVVYAEFGSLPGTIVLDEGGQMGESWPATHPEEFQQLPVTKEECDRAEKAVKLLRASGLNRNVQPENQASDVLQQKLKPGRPIILYAGQYDGDSGMIPYTENTRKFHSPCFTSSEEGMAYVAEIADRHDWNFIFKPHPLVKNRINAKQLPSNVIFIPDYNINDIIDIADVVITILSTTVYVSLVRDTAALMLGYNQISQKGCAYEAFCREDIEPALTAAVENGYTESQRAAFIRHVAQMNKYYLYTDGQKRAGLRLGRSIQEAAEFIARDIAPNAEALDLQENACIVCDSLSAMLFTFQLLATYPGWRPTLVMLDAEHLRPLLDKGACEKAFASMYWVSFDEEESLPRQFAEKLEDFTDFYLPVTGEKVLQIMNHALQREGAIPKFHFYESGSKEFLHYECVNALREATNAERQPTPDLLCELIACSVRQCKKDPRYALRQIGDRWRGPQLQKLLSPVGVEKLNLLCLAEQKEFPVSRLLNISQEFDRRREYDYS